MVEADMFPAKDFPELFETGVATPETDAKLKEEYIESGLADYLSCEGMIHKPQDISSMIGQWYLEGYNMFKDAFDGEE